MNVGDQTQVSGCFTQYKFLAGRPVRELERLIGYQSGRLAQGAHLVALLMLPQVDQFELSGYSNVAAHHFRFPAGLDADVLKREARKTWSMLGPDRLVKVLPATSHNPNLNQMFSIPMLRASRSGP